MNMIVNDVEALMVICMFGIILGLFCLINWVWDKQHGKGKDKGR